MKVIHKYAIEIADIQILSLPKDSKILSCQFQDDNLVLWAFHDESHENQQVKDVPIVIVGTGYSVGYGAQASQFISTVQSPGSGLVWHVFALE